MADLEYFGGLPEAGLVPCAPRAGVLGHVDEREQRPPAPTSSPP